MTAKILDGKKTALFYTEKLKEEIKELKNKYKKDPKLAVILVGEDIASQIYVRNKEKKCKELGIESKIIKLPKNTKEEEIIKNIQELNENKEINGILVQLPLPKHINENKIINTISPEKDVDGFTIINKGYLATNNNKGLIPCTPLGIMKLLEKYKIKIEGKHCVIIGRSQIVGKPIGELLLEKNGTITICHSKTKKLKEITKSADILISAMGKKANKITGEYIKDKAIVIDVAMIRDEKTNKLTGDIEKKSASKKASYITPVPGGIGPMTIAMLMNNTIEAFKKQNENNEI